jgi:hypothetical protein
MRTGNSQRFEWRFTKETSSFFAEWGRVEGVMRSPLTWLAKRNPFEPVVEKARIAFKGSGHNKSDHFVGDHVMIRLGKGGKRDVEEVQLSRNACSLVIQTPTHRTKLTGPTESRGSKA